MMEYQLGILDSDIKISHVFQVFYFIERSIGFDCNLVALCILLQSKANKNTNNNFPKAEIIMEYKHIVYQLIMFV